MGLEGHSCLLHGFDSLRGPGAWRKSQAANLHQPTSRLVAFGSFVADSGSGDPASELTPSPDVSRICATKPVSPVAALPLRPVRPRSTAMTLADQSMGFGLRALNRLASLELIDRAGLREPAERLVYRSTRNGFRAANAAGRTLQVGASGSASAARQSTAQALRRLRPHAHRRAADDASRRSATSRPSSCARPRPTPTRPARLPTELLAQSAELGITMLGVPEELGGAVAERSAVTSVLVTEALAGGDMGLAFAPLAPAAVSTAIGLWGDADQQSTYLPEFTGENVPAAALAMLEPRAALRPASSSRRRARRDGDGFVLDGAQVARARAPPTPSSSSSPPTSRARARRCSSSRRRPHGVLTQPEPAIGLRAAGTGAAQARRRRGSAPARCSPTAPPTSTPTASASAGSPGARWPSAPRRRALDFLIPYVNDRKAFGEPISHRQAVAFNMSNIAIEIEGMRLATYRAASLADQGKDFARETAIARQLCARQGHRRSAPTPSTCSAATATSRSTRSSAGTATCAPPA